MNLTAHRVALVIAAFAVVASLSVALVADGHLTASRAAAATDAAGTGTVAAAPILQATPAAPAPAVVYVRPAPPPQVIQVTQAAPPVAPTVVTITVPTTGGEQDDDAHEGHG